MTRGGQVHGVSGSRNWQLASGWEKIDGFKDYWKILKRAICQATASGGIA